MTNKPTTEMKLQAAIEALKAFTNVMCVDRGPGDTLYLACRNRHPGGLAILVIGKSDAENTFLETLGEALDNARMVTGELHFP